MLWKQRDQDPKSGPFRSRRNSIRSRLCCNFSVFRLVPARAALMTGRSPVAIQMTRFSAPLPIGVRTYPELLRAQGYFTGVAGRTYHLDGEVGNGDKLIKEIYDKHKMQTFQERLDFVRTGGMQKGIEQFSEFLDLKPKNKPYFCSFVPVIHTASLNRTLPVYRMIRQG